MTYRHLRTVFLLLAISMAPVSLSANLIVPLGTDARVDAGTPGLRTNPDVAMAPDGSFLVVWTDHAFDAEILGRRFDASGEPAGDPFEISIPGEQASEARVRFEPLSGDYLVLWTLAASHTESEALTARRVGSEGLGLPFRLAEAPTQNPRAPDLAFDVSGQALAVWYSSFPDRGVFGQRFMPSGQLIGPLLKISTDETFGDRPTAAAAAVPDRFEIAWGDGQLWTRTLRNGALSPSPFRLYLDRWEATDPRFIDGQWLVWTGYDADRTSVVTNQIGTASPLNAKERFASAQVRSEAATGAGDDAGRQLFVWSASRTGQGSVVDAGDVWAQVNSFRPGRATRINQAIAGRQGAPAVAGSQDGMFVAVWEETVDPEADTDSGIVMRRIQVVDTACIEDAHATCLRDGRFRVEVAWENFAGQTGMGEVIPFGTSTSALFSFFDPDNWELQVKLIDGCANNGHFWVFAAATTNVAYELRITDLVSGAVAVYQNPLGVASAAVTDTRAFACP